MKPERELNFTRICAEGPDSIELLEALVEMAQSMVAAVRFTITV